MNNPPPVKYTSWKASCPPDSPAQALSLDDPAPSQLNKTFIYDAQLAMDPCLHPSLLTSHGEFLAQLPNGPVQHQRLIPQFSYCPTTLHQDIRPSVPINWVEDLYPGDDLEWEDKVDERLMWRGTNTGMWHNEGKTRWRESQRARLVFWATELEGTASVLVPPKNGSDDGGASQRVGEPVEMRKAMLNPGMLDIAFAGEPNSCAPETCTLLDEIFEWKGPMNMKKAGRYKYVLDVRSAFLACGGTYILMFLSHFQGRWERLVQSIQAPYYVASTDIQSYCLPRMVPRPHSAVGSLRSHTS